MSRDRLYWKSYRKLRSNVKNHLNSIYNECADSFQEENQQFMPNIFGNDTERTVSDVVNVIPIDSTVEMTTGLDGNTHDAFSNQSDGTISSEDVSISSDECSDDDDDDDIDIGLCANLASWVSRFNISHSATHDLLQILRKYHSFLPKDPRTLLKTKTNYTVSKICGGLYYHFGLATSLENILVRTPFSSRDNINLLSLQINIDGLPLFRSSNIQFWPILCRVSKPFVSEPFVIGLYSGDQKPSPVGQYLSDFVAEMKTLHENGLHVLEMQKTFNVEISSFICDAPARSFVKQIKGHSGYHGCDKCTQKGLWKGKMTFPEFDAPLRTDVMFDEMIDPSHHLGPCPLQELSVGLVTHFPLDYMHLVCLGVMKRLLLLWLRGPLERSCRIASTTVKRISEKLADLRSYVPCEFLRKARSLHEVDRWKASEFRQFLLYTGPVVLRDCLSSPQYQNFLLLFVGIYCLSSPVFCSTYNNYANEILRVFVQDFARLYGNDMLVYNVHGLTHLANDVKKFGPLEDFSAFVFESFLGKLKRLVRKPSFPLQQVVRRLSEVNTRPKQNLKPFVLKKLHANGPVVRHCLLPQSNLQYKQLFLKDVCISLGKGNNCILVGGKVGLVRNIVSSLDELEMFVIFEEFSSTLNFFDVPLTSSDLKIFVVSDLSGELKVISISDILCKCVLLPYHGKFVSIPLLHTL